MNYILTYKGLSNSAKAVAKEISARLGEQIKVSYGENVRYNNAPIIRWGNPSFDFNNDTEFNSPKLLRIASNKLLFANTLKNGTLSVISFNRGKPEKFPVVVRKTLTGKAGEGIVVCEDYNSWIQYQMYYWSYYTPFEFELGVHIFKDSILKVFKKVGNVNEKYPIRNMNRGYGYERVNADKYPKLIPFIKQLRTVFPIGFGRADIGWDAIKKTYTHIEFNTAPGVSTNADTLESYVNNLVLHLKGV